jgi:hypothetical protein
MTNFLKYIVVIPILSITLGIIYFLLPDKVEATEHKDKPKLRYNTSDLVLPSNNDSVLKDITLPAIKETNSVITNRVVPITVTNNVEQKTNSIPSHQESLPPLPNIQPFSSLPLSPASFPVAYTCPYWLYRNPAVGRPVSDTVGE